MYRLEEFEGKEGGRETDEDGEVVGGKRIYLLEAR